MGSRLWGRTELDTTEVTKQQQQGVCACVCAWVCMYVCVCLCVSYRFNISSMTPITSVPLGIFFSLLPQLYLAHSVAALTRQLTLRGLLGDAPHNDQLL